MSKVFLNKLEDIKFYYDSYFRAYYILPPEDLQIAHIEIKWEPNKKFYREYLLLFRKLAKLLDVTVYRHKALHQYKDYYWVFTIVGEHNVLPVYNQMFTALFSALETYIKIQGSRHRVKNMNQRRKGEAVKTPHWGITSSNIRIQCIKNACNTIDTLLEDKGNLPGHTYTILRKQSIREYVKNAISTKGKSVLYGK